MDGFDFSHSIWGPGKAYIHFSLFNPPGGMGGWGLRELGRFELLDSCPHQPEKVLKGFGRCQVGLGTPPGESCGWFDGWVWDPPPRSRSESMSPAQEACAAIPNGTLAAVHSAYQQQFLASLFDHGGDWYSAPSVPAYGAAWVGLQYACVGVCALCVWVFAVCLCVSAAYGMAVVFTKFSPVPGFRVTDRKEKGDKVRVRVSNLACKLLIWPANYILF